MAFPAFLFRSPWQPFTAAAATGTGCSPRLPVSTCCRAQQPGITVTGNEQPCCAQSTMKENHKVKPQEPSRPVCGLTPLEALLQHYGLLVENASQKQSGHKDRDDLAEKNGGEQLSEKADNCCGRCEERCSKKTADQSSKVTFWLKEVPLPSAFCIGNVEKVEISDNHLVIHLLQARDPFGYSHMRAYRRVDIPENVIKGMIKVVPRGRDKLQVVALQKLCSEVAGANKDHKPEPATLMREDGINGYPEQEAAISSRNNDGETAMEEHKEGASTAEKKNDAIAVTEHARESEDKPIGDCSISSNQMSTGIDHEATAANLMAQEVSESEEDDDFELVTVQEGLLEHICEGTNEDIPAEGIMKYVVEKSVSDQSTDGPLTSDESGDITQFIVPHTSTVPAGNDLFDDEDDMDQDEVPDNNSTDHPAGPIQDEVPSEFCVTVDVKDFAPEELTVKLIGDKLSVHGFHQEESKGEVMEFEYRRSFVIPEDADLNQLKSQLSSDGILKVSSPWKAAVTDQVEKTIPLEY